MHDFISAAAVQAYSESGIVVKEVVVNDGIITTRHEQGILAAGGFTSLDGHI